MLVTRSIEPAAAVEAVRGGRSLRVAWAPAAEGACVDPDRARDPQPVSSCEELCLYPCIPWVESDFETSMYVHTVLSLAVP